MRFLHAAIDEGGLLHFLFLERGIVEQAGIETYGKKKIVAGRKIDAGEFAAFEMHILQTRLFQFHQADVAVFKRAIDEIISRQIRLFEIAAFENAIGEFPSTQFLVGVIDFLEGFVVVEGFGHGRILSQ